MKTITAILVALIWRILIAVLTRTFFQPDEFYQSLEIAHHAVFGYGHLTWEWTASLPIRSIFFPALYIPAYFTLKLIGWDNSEGLVSLWTPARMPKAKSLKTMDSKIIAPKIVQGVIAAITDVSTRELAIQLLGERYADTIFFLSLTSFFHILALSRTLSNSVETSLTAAALCFWPWHSFNTRRLWLTFALAAVSCLLRPTSVIIWAFLLAELYWRVRSNTRFVRNLFGIALTTALLSAGFLLCIDSLYFGKITFTPLNFVRTNLSSVSLFYGRSPWHYYLFQGLPILMNICLPSFVSSAWSISRRGLRHERTLLLLIIWTIFVYSLMGHKEWRFLHPVLPAMIVISAKSLVENGGKMMKTNTTAASRGNTISLATLMMGLLGVIPGLYVMRLHGSAQINVMSYLRSLDSPVLRSAGFLMPCHSTPWQAYLHKPGLSEGYLWALSCEPPLNESDISRRTDQTDVFYASPIKYLKEHFPAVVDHEFPPSPYPSTRPGLPLPLNKAWDHRWPSHLVFFGALVEDIKDGRKLERYLRELGYTEDWSGKNGFEEDWRRRGGVRVWQWQRRISE